MSETLTTNQGVGLLPQAARTATVASADQENRSFNGLVLVIDVTAKGTAPSVVFTLQGKDDVSGQYYTLLASAAILAVGTTVLRVFPGAPTTANLSASDVLPRTWRVSAVHGNADSLTYSVSGVMVLT